MIFFLKLLKQIFATGTRPDGLSSWGRQFGTIQQESVITMIAI